MVSCRGQQSALLSLQSVMCQWLASVLLCDAPWFVEAAVVHVGVEGGPVLAVLGDLEDPVPERRAAVAPAGNTVTDHWSISTWATEFDWSHFECEERGPGSVANRQSESMSIVSWRNIEWKWPKQTFHWMKLFFRLDKYFIFYALIIDMNFLILQHISVIINIVNNNIKSLWLWLLLLWNYYYHHHE